MRSASIVWRGRPAGYVKEMVARRGDLLSPGALASFTVAVALSAIFVDAAVGQSVRDRERVDGV
jgi:hypothetical protein